MIRRRIRHRTGFALGMAGAAMCIVGGLFILLGYGNARYLHLASFALSGAMLLVLGMVERGAENRPLRIKLLLLFFALFIAYFRLPLLDIIELIVFPATAMLYYKRLGKSRFPILALLLAEVLFAAVRTVMLGGVFGSFAHVYLGIATILVGVARGAFMTLLYQSYANEGD